MPSQSLCIGFTLNEAFSLFQSSNYCLQFPSLAFIYFYLLNDLEHLKNLPTLLASSSSSSSSLAPVVSAIKATKKFKKLRTQKEKLIRTASQSSPAAAAAIASSVYNPQSLLAICQNGFLRQLCWCLIHSQSAIRSLSLKVRLSSL